MEAKAVRCGACGFLYYFNTAAAAAAFIEDAAGRLLLVRRDREPGKGRLAPPGGFIDAGETVAEALRREVREEVGLELGEAVFLVSYPNHYRYRGIDYPTLDLFFHARVADFGAARALDEAEGLVVAPLAEVAADQMAFPSMAKALSFLQRRDCG